MAEFISLYSGSSGNKMTNIMSGSKFYIDYTSLDDGTRVIEATDGKTVYLKTSNEGGTYQHWYKDGMCYDYAQFNGLSQAFKYKVDETEGGISATKDLVANAKVDPNYEIKKINKTYYAEVIEVEGVKAAYCFEGDKLVYIVEVDEDGEYVLKVNEYKSNFDESILNLPAGVDFKDLK